MKMSERLQAKKKDNKGFSLVELIIVIAIMAILVGVVGTQVVPYLNKSKAAKDQQVLNAFCTAAVSGYSYKADKVTYSGEISFNYYATKALTVANPDGSTEAGAEKIIQAEMENLITYSSADELKKQMSSTYGQGVTDVTITINFSKHTCTASIVTTNGTAKPKVEDVVATL